MSLLRFEIHVKPAPSYCAARAKKCRRQQAIPVADLQSDRLSSTDLPSDLLHSQFSTLDRSHTQAERDTTQQMFLKFFPNISLTPQTQNNIVAAGYMGVCLDGPSTKQSDLFAIRTDSNLQCEQKDRNCLENLAVVL